MSERWKNISNTDKTVIKANTIFANKLIGNNSEFRNDICFNNIDISFDEDIIIDNVKTVRTHNRIKTILLKSNVIDLSDTDPSYIDISSVIYTNLSGGFYYLRAEDLSTSDLYVDNLSVNAISLHTGNNYLPFNSDSVSFDNTIMASDISVNYIGSLYDSSMTIHPDTIIDGSLNVGTLVTENIYNAQSNTNHYIEIDGDISTIHIGAMDISVSNSTKVGGDLSLNAITSRADSSYITFNTDISVNGYADASAVTVHNIYTHEQTILEIKNDLSINGGLRIHDISFDGSLSPIDGCLNVVGDVSFTNHLQVKKTTTKSFTHHSSHNPLSHNDGSGIVFQNDVSIVGIILANNKPKDYKAVVSNDFNELVFELANNYQDGALGLLTPAQNIQNGGEPVYTDDSLNDFNPSNNDASYVSLDFNNSQNQVTLYLQVSKGNVKKIATINDDISLHAIRMTRGSDISNWTNAYDDVSHTFGYNTSAIIGLRNGIFNDDSYNRIHYLDVSAFDPEGFDVSHMFYSEAETSPDSYPGFDVSFVNDPGYRIKVITPSSESVSIPELSFNIVLHDYTNYIIRQVSLKHDKHLTAKEPSWNEIKLRTYDFSHQAIVDTELSWNDLSTNQISEANTSANNTAYFDISLNQYFGDNSDNIYYVIDLSAIYNTSDPSFNSNLDLSFNIKINDGDLSRNVELSGSQLIVETSIPNGKTIADYENIDTSINIIVHNYYDFTNQVPSFDFDAAGIDPAEYGYTSAGNPNYNKDISRNIVLKVYDSIINRAPEFTYFEFYGISYGDGWKPNYHNDNSFNSGVLKSEINKENANFSYIYYIWDTSSILDNSSLQYRIDFSGDNIHTSVKNNIDISSLFNFDISTIYAPDTSINFDFTSINKSEHSLLVTTSGNRSEDEPDSKLSLCFDNCGNFMSDMCYNKIDLTFHPFLYKFKAFTFTNCDASGCEGPSLIDCSDKYTERYNSSSDISSLDYWWTKPEYLDMNNNGIQLWMVPATGQYDITIAGAGGGRSYGDEPENKREGYGAVFDTSVILHRGDKYRILIGQRGQLGNTNSENITGYQDKIPMASSGGGGTFFVKDDERLNIDSNLTTANSDPDEVMNIINDISDLFIAVAGGGSGGRTWDDDYDSSKKTITDASHNKTANSGHYDDEIEREEFINVNEYAPGREIGQLTYEDGNVYSGQFPFTGGGGGGGLIRVGGYAGNDVTTGSNEAKSFILGGKGGLNTNTRIGIIGNAKFGGFGGGGAGGDGGSGGGGGYAGGGADTHTKIVVDNLSGKNINPDKKSYAGGGSSFVNETLNMNMSHNSHNINSDSNGYLHIRFNPYNK